MRFGSALVGLAVLCATNPSLAYDQLVEKQSFTIPEFTTQGGATIRDMRLGWEAYGTLNAAKDNVILVAHYFSGSSHAAGKYAAEDKAAGYWDSIIGAGRPVDTDK
jgi:homoserine O-acetyltransferase